MSRKPNSNAKLHNLPLDQQQELCDWLLGGTGYVAARGLVAKKFNVKTSLPALHDFYHSFCVPELARQRMTSRDTAAEIVADAKESPGQWTDAALEKLEQYAFELMLMPGADPKHVKSIFAMVFKRGDAAMDREKLDLEKRKVALAEQKAAERDEAKEITSNDALTADEKQARLKQIFGMG